MPLPLLSTPSHGETVIVVRVQQEQCCEDRRSPAWVVDEKPARKLGRGQLVLLTNNSGRTGPGLLTAITDLRQHWVTWSVSGGPHRVWIRIPIPWTSMTGVEAVAHAKHFCTLPSSPAPHPSATPTRSDETDPYPYDQHLDDEEHTRLTARLEAITQKKWEWKPEQERKRRRVAPADAVDTPN